MLRVVWNFDNLLYILDKASNRVCEHQDDGKWKEGKETLKKREGGWEEEGMKGNIKKMLVYDGK